MSRLWQWLAGASIVVFVGCAIHAAFRGTEAYLFSSPGPVVLQQQSSSQDVAELRAILDAGRLEELRWPDFTNRLSSAREFYERNGDALAWVKGNGISPQASALIAELQQANLKGLQPEDYDGPRWSERVERLQRAAAATERDRAVFDVALTVSAMRYASDLSLGRVNPQHLSFGFNVEKNRFDLAEFIFRLAHAQDVDSTLRELDPPFPVYHRTLRALQEYLQLARDHESDTFAPVRKPVKPGDAYPDAPKLTRLLRTLGDLNEEATASARPVYEGSLVDAVKRFQRRHGLQGNGWITPTTIKELNVPLTHRVLQLQLALERLRWLPRRFARPPLVVNIPEFKLHALDEHYRSALTSNVVVGKAYQHATPAFEGSLHYLIFRPYWDVPYSITRAELLPIIARDPSYLNANNYEIVAANGRVLEDREIGQNIFQQLRSGALRIRQKPGPENALGLVKFVFPNEHDVYLHSSPARSLFRQPRRDFSHGCIRVEHAEELAAWCLRSKPGWTVNRIRAAMNGTETVRVNLDRPIPVLIVYGTAVASSNGEVRFFDDIYGYDAELERTLALAGPR